MRRMFSCLAVLAVAVLCSSASRAQEGHSHHPPGDVETLGKVDFPISCSPEAQGEFNRAVATLHSFWYPQAEKAFAAIAEREPECAIAYWGVAMSLYHPLWSPASEADAQKALAALEKAKQARTATARERGYLAAIAAYYDGFGKLDHPTRARAWSRKMEELHRKYPEDREAAIFYALSLLATARRTDTTYTNQKAATAILEKIWATDRRHPGVAHYLIHGYDSPVMAPQGLDAARAYAKIAPAAAHALHMPSHIFSRLGLWEESVESNIASAEAARRYTEQGMLSAGDEIHALDFLMNAYMQMRDLEAARGVIQRLRAIGKTEDDQHLLAYAHVVVPARYLVEQGMWQEAGIIGPMAGGATTRAMIYWIRGVGAARSGKPKLAQQSEEALALLVKSARSNPDVDYQENLEVARLSVQAWLAKAAGRSEEAVQLMREAAKRDDGIIYSRTRIVPAREQLAEMLAELGRTEEALAEYEAALQSAPGRFNALLGASRAAAALGQQAKAESYTAQLKKQAPKARLEAGARPAAPGGN
jgi:tetratricopeptide (TPR) repeat protein